MKRFFFFLVVCGLTAFVSIATAQRSGAKKPAGKGTTTSAKKNVDASTAATNAPMTPDTEHSLSTSGASGSAKGQDPKSLDGGNGGAIETRTGDGGAKSYRFEEVSIEGRLQSPELVYFLRRVRAEFNAGDLGHRSFIGELSDTKHDPNLN